jgi:DNA-binding NtrC family response regulator
LSPEIGSTQLSAPADVSSTRRPGPAKIGTKLSSAVEQVERDLIQAALDRSGGNISESARVLGLTRRGLYLKLRRLGLDTQAELDTH